MTGFLGEAYLWVKALHIVAVIAWMAGLLYLPRLFVYHAEAAPGSETAETLKVMERRLLRAIMNPAMIVVWVVGLVLMINIAAWEQPWFHAKAVLILILSYHHHQQARWRKDFANDANQRPQRFYRMMNEVPTVLMILIVLLAVVRPF